MDVKEIAAGVAADIREHGHYRDLPGQDLYDPTRSPFGECCVFYNPTVFKFAHGAYNRDNEADSLLTEALKEQLDGDDFLIKWNDETPTDQVLEVLDKIAAGT